VRHAIRLVTVLAVLTAVYLTAPLDSDLWWLGLIIGLVALVGIAPFAYRRASKVAGSAHPVAEAGEAILMIAFMVIFGFSAMYVAVNRHTGQFVGIDTRLDAMYFTVTTVATVGYGDIYASGQLSRGLVSIQMMFDLTLLALSIRLLGSAARHRVGMPSSL
jgi:hypothetical protein